MQVKFRIDGEPVPQARPRFTKSGKTYTPARCANYRKRVAVCAVLAMIGIPRIDKDTPIIAYLDFFRACKPTARSDIDNLAKAILDSCNNIIYHDDSQIVEIHCRKFKSDDPHVDVTFIIEGSFDEQSII